MKKRYLSLLVIFVIALRLSAQQPWIVPAQNLSKLSTFAFSDSTRKAGTDIYNTNCKSCHGDPGKNNVIKLVPPPVDPASDRMQANTDGGLYYKITQGRVLMPSFKNILSSNDVWIVISYLRSFSEKYVQVVAPKVLGGATVQNIKIQMNWLKEQNQVQAVITWKKDNVGQPLVSAKVKLFVKRYFGNLQIDEARNTDAQGKALFDFPKDLPGDSTGYVQLSAKLTDEAVYGEAKNDTTLAIGVPTYRPPLNEQRAMWNVVQKTPIWLLLSYSFTVLTVWSFIFYVLFQIRAIYKSGLSKDQDIID